MRNILGLDLGTNSIGIAVVQRPENDETQAQTDAGKILLAGSRVIPMPDDQLGDFGKGNTKSQTAERRTARSIRTLKARFQLRRERLNRVLNVLGFLPEHYAAHLDTYGRLEADCEALLPWVPNTDGKRTFLFKAAYTEMLALLRSRHPDLERVPYDWTIYYLRRKALHEAVTGAELAWILHHFNQKRGYNQSRAEVEEEKSGERVECLQLTVTDVADSGEKRGKRTLYHITLEDGHLFPLYAEQQPDWVGTKHNFIIRTKLDKDGQPQRDKTGKERCSVTMPAADDWMLVKTLTQNLITHSKKEPGEYIFDLLLDDPMTKIKGGAVTTIDRTFYRHELERIIDKQLALHPAWQDEALYAQCTQALYPTNATHRHNVQTWGLRRLLVDDVLLYQRPLKSKKSLIERCTYEVHTYTDPDTGERKPIGVKCIPASHPLYQEFRLWHFISNLRVLRREVREGDRLVTDRDETATVLGDDAAYAALFDWLQTQEKVTQKSLLKRLKLSAEDFRLNLAEDKTYPAAETRALIQKHLKKAGLAADTLTAEQELQLWHILYSVNTLQELARALETFARKQGFAPEAFRTGFIGCKPFESRYGAYSEKALRKLLPLMRRGSYWSADAIDGRTRERIMHLITGEEDEGISLRTREMVAKAGLQQDINQYRGLPVWLVGYVVYDRHAEAKAVEKWDAPEQLDAYIKHVRPHSLRNPIVEQVVLEALRTVRDAWQAVGHIDEIHIELGREMQMPAKKRAEQTARIAQNETRNLRIRAMLEAFMHPELKVENVRPYSPSQQELLKIYEEGAFESAAYDLPEHIKNTLKGFEQTDPSKRPSLADINRYKMWLEQRYCSPYTGRMIPLGKLFTTDYEIEHVIPQSRYFDNSLSNKVICEAAVNKLKGNMTGLEFIKKCGGKKVECGTGNEVVIFTQQEYERFVEDHYKYNKRKRERLLSEDLPTGFTNRQLNDTRYIARFITGALSNIVRTTNELGEIEAEVTSRNVIVCNGQVTDRLKRDWGLNDVWNDLVRPRFERLNAKTNSSLYGQWENKDGKRVFQTNVPLDQLKGFSKKRIDHRHHAMDAIAIACCTRSMVNYLNNQSGNETEREDLKRAICRKTKPDSKGNYQWLVKQPWEGFIPQAADCLKSLVVSFKHNARIVTKTTNRYMHFNPQTGKKELTLQTKGDHWAIRKPLHKDTVYGRVNLRSIQETTLKKALMSPSRIVDKTLKAKVKELKKLPNYPDKFIEKFFKESTDPQWKDFNWKKIAVYCFSDDAGQKPMVATRKTVDTSFDAKKIGTITDTGIRKILLRHLQEKGNDPQVAFSPEGLVEMNEQLTRLNDGKPHQPIFKVRLSEPLGLKYSVGERGCKAKKFVVAAKGTNLFFAIYQKEDKRTFETIPLSIAIERKKQGLPPVPERDADGNPLLFSISPNDLVYLPSPEEIERGVDEQHMDVTRIYKMVSSTESRCSFIPYNVATPIVPGFEFLALNKIEITDEGRSIKEHCLPLEVDRLGRYRLKKK